MEIIAMGTSIGYAIIAAVCFAAPVFVFFRAKKYDSAMIYPVIVGAVTYFIATRMSDLAVWILFSEAPMSHIKPLLLPNWRLFPRRLDDGWR